MKYHFLVLTICGVFLLGLSQLALMAYPVGRSIHRDRDRGARPQRDETDCHPVPQHVDTFDGGPDWGVMGTVTAGYDYQLPQGVVIGAFTDFDFTNSDFTTTSPDGDTNRLRERSAFNVGGRLGYLISRSTLLCANGGYTRGNFKFSYSDEYSNGKTFDGWFVGDDAERRSAARGASNSSTDLLNTEKSKSAHSSPPSPWIKLLTP